MTPETMDALALSIKPDGEGAFVVMRDDSVAAWLVRSKRNRTIWTAMLANGTIQKGISISALLDWTADNLPPRRR